MESKIFRLKRIRAQVRRLLPILFLFLILLMMLLVRSNNPALVRTRSAVGDFFLPVISFVRQPVYWVKNAADGIKDWVLTYHENKVLKEENENLKQLHMKALRLEVENNELKRHLNYHPSQKLKELVAEIVLDEGGAFSRSFIVLAGKNQGVTKGMLGFGPKALFARVVEVGNNHSRLMPLTDYMSRVPVYVGKERKKAYLMGDNTDMPYLLFLNENDVAYKSDMIFSSGYMGGYPSDLPIGRVYSESEDSPRVLLFEDIDTLSFVRLVDFGLTGNLLKQDMETP